jgi:hypothetical protein
MVVASVRGPVDLDYVGTEQSEFDTPIQHILPLIGKDGLRD